MVDNTKEKDENYDEFCQSLKNKNYQKGYSQFIGELFNFNKINNQYELLAGEDDNKDQSYFLWTLTQKQLSKTLFPVGNIEKPAVRACLNPP